jgi:hypothetical protein
LDKLADLDIVVNGPADAAGLVVFHDARHRRRGMIREGRGEERGVNGRCEGERKKDIS